MHLFSEIRTFALCIYYIVLELLFPIDSSLFHVLSSFKVVFCRDAEVMDSGVYIYHLDQKVLGLYF